MKRVERNGKKYLIGYHTQEYRGTTLENPICCQAVNAWLGIGYYFWTEIEFAQYWGEDFKKGKTGYYDVYEAELDIENCINAVFDEEGYFFLRKKIEETIESFQKSGKEITLQKVHRFLAENIWNNLGVTGLIYDDKPSNPNPLYKIRIYSEIPDLYYKKRIQVVLFDTRNIHNFELVLEEQT